MSPAELRVQLRARWQQLPAREKKMTAIAIAVVTLALLWWVAIAPALSTLRTAEAQHAALDAQLQQMLGLRAQAQALQAQPRQSRDDALRLLDASVRQGLGPGARMATTGERVTVTVSGVAPEILAQWLTQARVNARAVPGEARLQRNAAGLWDGTLVLNLPQR
jgi:general secretion pathway protein M